MRFAWSTFINRKTTDFELDWQPPEEALRDNAVKVAREADVVVAFVGLSPDLEGEEMHVNAPGFDGGDRTRIELPDVQDKLVDALLGTGKPVVIVLMSGSAIALSAVAQRANAILEAWYPGEEGGDAIAETLAGQNNPAGRLPVTFYRSTDNLPPFTDYSMTNRTYRYYTGPVLYPFGYRAELLPIFNPQLQTLFKVNSCRRDAESQCCRNKL